jgi:hypothetical protein
MGANLAERGLNNDDEQSELEEEESKDCELTELPTTASVSPTPVQPPSAERVCTKHNDDDWELEMVLMVNGDEGEYQAWWVAPGTDLKAVSRGEIQEGYSAIPVAPGTDMGVLARLLSLMDQSWRYPLVGLFDLLTRSLSAYSHSRTKAEEERVKAGAPLPPHEASLAERRKLREGAFRILRAWLDELKNGKVDEEPHGDKKTREDGLAERYLEFVRQHLGTWQLRPLVEGLPEGCKNGPVLETTEASRLAWEKKLRSDTEKSGREEKARREQQRVITLRKEEQERDREMEIEERKKRVEQEKADSQPGKRKREEEVVVVDKHVTVLSQSISSGGAALSTILATEVHGKGASTEMELVDAAGTSTCTTAEARRSRRMRIRREGSNEVPHSSPLTEKKPSDHQPGVAPLEEFGVRWLSQGINTLVQRVCGALTRVIRPLWPWQGGCAQHSSGLTPTSVDATSTKSPDSGEQSPLEGEADVIEGNEEGMSTPNSSTCTIAVKTWAAIISSIVALSGPKQAGEWIDAVQDETARQLISEFCDYTMGGGWRTKKPRYEKVGSDASSDSSEKSTTPESFLDHRKKLSRGEAQYLYLWPDEGDSPLSRSMSDDDDSLDASDLESGALSASSHRQRQQERRDKRGRVSLMRNQRAQRRKRKADLSPALINSVGFTGEPPTVVTFREDVPVDQLMLPVSVFDLSLEATDPVPTPTRRSSKRVRMLTKKF